MVPYTVYCFLSIDHLVIYSTIINRSLARFPACGTFCAPGATLACERFSAPGAVRSTVSLTGATGRQLARENCNKEGSGILCTACTTNDRRSRKSFAHVMLKLRTGNHAFIKIFCETRWFLLVEVVLVEAFRTLNIATERRFRLGIFDINGSCKPISDNSDDTMASK